MLVKRERTGVHRASWPSRTWPLAVPPAFGFGRHVAVAVSPDGAHQFLRVPPGAMALAVSVALNLWARHLRLNYTAAFLEVDADDRPAPRRRRHVPLPRGLGRG